MSWDDSRLTSCCISLSWQLVLQMKMVTNCHQRQRHWLPHGHWQLKYNYLSSSKNISGWLASKACLKETFVDFICICFSHHLCNGVVTLPTPEGPEQPHPSQNNRPWIHLANQFLPLPADNFRCFKRNGRLTEYLCGQYRYKCIRQPAPGVNNDF